MKNIFLNLINYLEKDNEVMLVTVLHHYGSTPRKAGANMIVLKEQTEGTIGGGSIEYQAILLARKLLEKKQSLVKDYFLTKNERDDIGMICGGKMLVAFCYLTKADLIELNNIKTYLSQNKPCWFDLEIKEQFKLKITALKDKLHQNNSCFIKDENRIFFTLPIIQKGTVYIFGGGHISRELVQLLNNVAFNCVVIDNDPALITKQKLENVKYQIMPFEQIEQNIAFDHEDYAIIVTRGHEFDALVLKQVLKQQLTYVGMIGSKKKIKATYERLKKEAGYQDEDFNNVYAPIGLAIGAQTPEEIAIAICAQLIQVRFEQNNK